MRAFEFSTTALEPERYRRELEDRASGGYASFEGWVRDHNEGRTVERLEYEAFEALAIREGERIVAEAIERYGVRRAACVHRVGDLALGDLAVWVGVSAPHRGEAFAACRYIIDEVKHRLPIWKKEHYVDGDSGWVNCERCALPSEHTHQGQHDHDHTHGHGAAEVPALAAPDYSRQVALAEVGVAGQQRLEESSVLVIGAGGLGVPVLQYLAAAGVGRLGIVDHDRVEASNLHRQPLYGPADIGRAKATVASERLRALNPAVVTDVIERRADLATLGGLLGEYDLVVDCSDNFATKFAVSDAAVRAAKPAVFASVYQYEGQLQVYLPREDWPCLRCLWPEAPRDGLVGNCAQAGVLGPVPAALGAMQAMQALKLLLGLEPEATPAVHAFDLLGMQWRTIKASRRAECEHASGISDPHPHSVRPLPQAGEVPEQAGEVEIELEYPDLAAARASGLTLVDIREAWERMDDDPAESIEMHVPLSALLDGQAALPPGRYLLVCAHGVRSLALAEHLRSQGYAEAYSLLGGLSFLRA